MRGRKLKSGVYGQGALKQKGVKQELRVFSHYIDRHFARHKTYFLSPSKFDERLPCLFNNILSSL
jgi:hypothetical protein